MKKIILLMAFFSYSPIHALTYPSITKQPLDQMVVVGSSVAFLVVSTGAVPLSFQWQRNPATGIYENIIGATDPILMIPKTLISNNGYRFRCSISNSFGKALSNSGILFVNPVISTVTAQTVNVLTDEQLNTIKETIWVDVFRDIANLDESYFVGVATGDWALNKSSMTFHWVPVHVDTETGVTCFISTNTEHPSWNDTFKMNIITKLLSQAWDDVTFPYDTIESLDEARNLGVFH